jgi:hypothetical protein
MSDYIVDYAQTAQTPNLNFSDALSYLKKGHRLARAGWNGRDLSVYLINETTSIEFEDQYDGFNLDATLQPYFVIISGNRIHTWVPSVSDILAIDWKVI